MVLAPVAEAQAQGRGRAASTSAQRGGNSQGGAQRRPGSSNGTRPGGSSNGTRPGNQGKPGRPGNSGASDRPGGTRPGGNHQGGGASHRPGNTNPPANRPGNNRPGNNGGNNRPGNGGHHHKPGDDHRPGHRPPRPGRPDYGHRPPRPGRPSGLPPRPMGPGYRHPVPFFGHWHHPAPPPRWHYSAGAGPVFSTILGVALGATLASSLNSLAANGYTVCNYGNDVVYLSNVPQMNLMWPDAAMYYNNGMLCGSQFTYPTTYYDMSRYNALYNRFVRLYGAPVSTTNSGGVVSATWFGGDNRFVTIEFNGSYGDYYTTLSYGM